jgi:hypothetical protein
MMAKLDTGTITDVTTQSETSGRTEIKVGDAATPCEIATGAYSVPDSLPSGLPEVPEMAGCGYVFRIGESPPLGSVIITLDTKQLVEQAEVRKINRAIERARRR